MQIKRLFQQYQKLFELNDIALNFDDNALKEIAKIAFKRKTGARGLRSIIENVLLDLMFEFPNRGEVKEILIDSDVVKLNSKPKIKYHDSKKVKNKKVV